MVDLAQLARRYDIGFNIDAEEADRLDLSLDLLAALAAEPALADWDGLGFVVQAYQKRARAVVDWIVALARRTNRQLMVRLVKGAYWDSEIKRAQVDGLADYPVFTRKVHTDVAYSPAPGRCSRRRRCGLSAVRDPQRVHDRRGPHAGRRRGRTSSSACTAWARAVYDQVVGGRQARPPCRIYAPVGSHETLLAYLVRRLLENGANTSFVNRIVDPACRSSIAGRRSGRARRAHRRHAASAAFPLPAAHPARPAQLAGVDLSDDAAARRARRRAWNPGSGRIAGNAAPRRFRGRARC